MMVGLPDDRIERAGARRRLVFHFERGERDAGGAHVRDSLATAPARSHAPTATDHVGKGLPMPPLLVHCPVTRRFMFTGMSTDEHSCHDPTAPRTGRAAYCPYCHAMHRWDPAEVILGHDWPARTLRAHEAALAAGQLWPAPPALHPPSRR